jgi:hypothetical protein
MNKQQTNEEFTSQVFRILCDELLRFSNNITIRVILNSVKMSFILKYHYLNKFIID